MRNLTQSKQMIKKIEGHLIQTKTRRRHQNIEHFGKFMSSEL